MAGLDELKVLNSAFDSPTFGKDGSFELDKPVGSASISPCGRDVVLASRQGLHIIDLDSPWSPPRHLLHHTPWEVADVQWSPFASRDYWVVSTSNQKALVWNLAMTNARASIEHVLHAHTRAVTDINFSAHHPDILATCAVDSYVHCWDLRHSARPAVTFCDWFAGATQVKWNRQNPHILASSHNKMLRIWDDRKGAHPLRSIEAHSTKIYGVDWNRTETNNVATCSLDKTVKFWDYTSDADQPKWIIETPFPVWRARHTPFGSGLLAMPQRGDYDLHLYDRRQGESSKDEGNVQSIHQFSGHDDQVKEFLWRSRGSITDTSDNREFQLVSWGKDRVLRLHHVDQTLYNAIGYERGEEVRNKFSISRRNAQYKTFRENTLRPRTQNFTLGIGRDVQSQEKVDYGSQGVSGMTLGRTTLNLKSGGGIASSVAGRKANQHQDVDAISWMKGVKIGKRENTLSDLNQSFPSILSPMIRTNRIWDTFESLGEEITHVGDKFNKVLFDKVDVANRYVIVSCSGPWGVDNSPVYTKIRLEFPRDYPEKATPIISLEKTMAMKSDILQKISSETQSVADAYLSRQRSSLEAILRYLLGEQSLEDSILWLKERSDHTDLDLSQDLALSSSDEDDEDADRYMNAQGQGMNMSDDMLATLNAGYNVPKPRTCGALWSDDGRLVCFFPSKDGKSQSFLDLSLKGSERSSRSHRILSEGFGRFYDRSLIPKKIAPALETIESNESDSENLSTSSSGSSSSSEISGIPRHHLISSIAWRGDISETQRAVSVDESQKSSGGTGITKILKPKSANFISIHNFTNLLPSRKMLALQYSLDRFDSFTQNAEIAAKNSDHDLADAWEFIDLILRKEIPLISMQHPYKDESILVAVRRTLSDINRKGSAIDLSYDARQDVKCSAKGSVKWGIHPFGRMLVQKLFHHFERSADIQMLGMLSCVFSKFQADKFSSTKANLGDRYVDMGSSAVSFSPSPSGQRYLDSYFPSAEVARSILKPKTSDLPMYLDPTKVIGISRSGNSSIGASNSDPSTPFSTDGTPPSVLKPSRTTFERTSSQTTSISTSPEQNRQTHRSSSNLASAFAASLYRPFSFTTSASSSPPTTYPKKRLSPAGSYLSSTPTGVTWGATSFMGKSSTKTENIRSSYSRSHSDVKEEVTTRKPVFEVRLKNQDRFHNNGYATVPLLDQDQEWRYRAYRESYAHMLYVWKMPFERCELLKFNKTTSTSSRSADQRMKPSPLAIGKSAANFLSRNISLGLDLRRHCRSCSNVIPPQNYSQDCSFCASSQTPLVCLFCTSLIQGLASPCLSCGHTLHLSCRSTLISFTSISSHDGYCISGCGCNCASHAVVEVEYPTRRKSSASITVTGDSMTEQESNLWHDPCQEDEDIWEDVAYESLARNLGARYLTPRPSQIWRGSG